MPQDDRGKPLDDREEEALDDRNRRSDDKEKAKMRIKMMRFFVGGFFLLIFLANASEKLTIKGRAAMGYFRGGSASAFPTGSVNIPDTRIVLNFFPDNNIDLTARFNLSNAGPNTPLLDYLYVQGKDFIPSLKGTPSDLQRT